MGKKANPGRLKQKKGNSGAQEGTLHVFCIIKPPSAPSHFTGDVWVLSSRLILKQVTALPTGVALGKKDFVPQLPHR